MIVCDVCRENLEIANKHLVKIEVDNGKKVIHRKLIATLCETCAQEMEVEIYKKVQEI